MRLQLPTRSSPVWLGLLGLLLFVCPALGTAAPRNQLVEVRDSGRELGTTYDIVLVVPRSGRKRAKQALARARRRVGLLSSRFSEWRADSEISRLNRDASTTSVTLSADLHKMLRGALHISRVTNGAFDISWAPLGPLWKRARIRQSMPSERELAACLRRVGWRGIRLRGGRLRFMQRGMRLGVAGVAKGWIIDTLFLQLKKAGFRHIVVNIGGDLRSSGLDINLKKRRFYIADPFHKKRIAASLLIGDTALATSGNYMRYHNIAGRRIGHILDPRTGRPPKFEGSVTVLTRDAAMADALATALFVMGPQKGLAFVKLIPGLDAIYITRSGLLSSLNKGRLLPGK